MTKLIKATNLIFALPLSLTCLVAMAWLFVPAAVTVGIWTITVMTLISGGFALGALVEWFRTRRAELIRDRMLAHDKAERSALETDRQNMRLQAEGNIMTATVRQIEQGIIHAGQLGDGVKFSSFPAQVINQIGNGVPLLETESRQDLLPALVDCPNILIVGGKGRGKTHLLLWLEHDRLNRGNVVTVLDSHAVPAQWGGQVVGAGREYESIAAAMIDLNTTLDTRYQQRTKGEADFSVIDTFIDEFTLLPDSLKKIDFNVQDYSKPALTEGRKVAMNCVWGIHSDRAAALGLKGAMDLLECFDAIVYLKKVQNDYYAMVDFGEGTGGNKYNHPGKFTIDRPASKPTILTLTTPPKPELMPTDIEATAIKAFEALRTGPVKSSWNVVIKAAYGDDKSGKFYHDKLKKTLDKFEYDY